MIYQSINEWVYFIYLVFILCWGYYVFHNLADVYSYEHIRVNIYNILSFAFIPFLVSIIYLFYSLKKVAYYFSLTIWILPMIYILSILYNHQTSIGSYTVKHYYSEILTYVLIYPIISFVAMQIRKKGVKCYNVFL